MVIALPAAASAPALHVEPRHEQLDVDDLRALFRLEGELGELPRGSEQQRQHALHGLAALVGAQVAIWGRFGDLQNTNGLITDVVHLGWSGERERRLYEEFVERGGQVQLPDPVIDRLAGVYAPPVTTTLRTPLLSDDEWYRSPHVEAYRRAGDVDSFLHSVRLAPRGSYVISLHRPWGARQFNERERRLVDLFHRESRALAPPPQSLPPHLDKTLRQLLRGLSEKQVAAELGLSPHTVHDYVRALYRHFRVGSRAELFARLTSRR